MPLQSDLSLNPTPFLPSSVSTNTTRTNEAAMASSKGQPKWFEIGAAKFRELSARGETFHPPPQIVESGKAFEVPSRDGGRQIPCRLMLPEKGAPRGVFLHVHGGGFVLGSEAASDPYIKFIADETTLAVVSVGYRLAPENPFPAAPNDCYDAAVWLANNAEQRFGAKLRFIGGESAGGHLAIHTALNLTVNLPSLVLSGLVLHYGVYDISFLPSVKNFHKPSTLMLDEELMQHYGKAFCSGMSEDQLKDPAVSPVYTDLYALRGKLPPALFTVGTEDCLLDDTMLMALKWQMAGAETILKVLPGAPHIYIHLPPEQVENSRVGREYVKEYLHDKL